MNAPLGGLCVHCSTDRSIDASTAADDIGSGCAVASQASKDRVYDVTAAGEGVLSIDVRADGSGLGPFFHINIATRCRSNPQRTATGSSTDLDRRQSNATTATPSMATAATATVS